MSRDSGVADRSLSRGKPAPTHNKPIPTTSPFPQQARLHIYRPAGCRGDSYSVILSGFSTEYARELPTMEINPILNTIKDLTERSESIRGYL